MRIYWILIILSFNAFAGVNPCSLEYLGMQNLVNDNQLARVTTLERLEGLSQRLRAKKANPNIVEVDRYYIERLIRLDNLLYEGNTFLAKKTWKPFIRKFEREFYAYKKNSTLLQAAQKGKLDNIEDVVLKMMRDHADDPFMLELLNRINSKKFINRVDELIVYLEKQLKKSAKQLGKNYKRYYLIRDHLDHVIKSERCDAHCKESLNWFKKELGVQAADEQERFRMFTGLKTPKLSEVRALVNQTPAAYERMILKEALMELNAAFRDIYTLPNSRRVLAKAIFESAAIKSSMSPGFIKWSVKSIDNVLTEVEAVTNHYPLINNILRREADIQKQFNRLRNQNVIFADDEMLVTFARRVDQRAIDNWERLSKYAQDNDTLFYNRMVAAKEKALIKGGLSPDYRRNPFRAMVYIVGTIGGYQLLNLTFWNETEELIEEVIGESGEVIEALNLNIEDEEHLNFIIENSELLMDAANKVKEGKE